MHTMASVIAEVEALLSLDKPRYSEAAKVLVAATSHLPLGDFLAFLASPDMANVFNAMTKTTRGGGGANVRRRERMVVAQDGICTLCGLGEVAGDPWEAAHLVPASWHEGRGTGANRAGFVEGCLTVWHRSCNDRWGPNLVGVSSLARPDLVWRGLWNDLPKAH